MNDYTGGTWGLWDDMPGAGITGPAAAASFIADRGLRDAKYKNYAEVISSNKSSIAICFGIDKYEANANARLIAAAPELLEALSNLLNSAERANEIMLREAGIGVCDVNAIEQARAIIAKAEGA